MKGTHTNIDQCQTRFGLIDGTHRKHNFHVNQLLNKPFCSPVKYLIQPSFGRLPYGAPQCFHYQMKKMV
jgi:hypothetical protein